MSRATAFVLSFAAIFTLATTTARAEDIVKTRAALYGEYAEKLDQLAAACEKQNLSDAARTLKDWLPKREPNQLTLFLLSPLGASDQLTLAKSGWQKEWQTLRDHQADELFALAKQAVNEHRPSLAYELVTETVRENPDHKQGRRLLGFVRQRERWLTPFDIHQLGSGKVWTETFGWLPKAYVERYRKGQRYYQGRWMSADDEKAMRTDLKHGWRVDSAHYAVTTNHSLEEGVRLSRELETLYGIWQQVFIPFQADEAELRRRFEGRVPRNDSKQHDVAYFRTRQEYNDALRAAQPKIDMTLGIYLDSTQTAYFFAGEDQDPGTVYHEATHQLFQESGPVVANVARHENFWIVEGIACYMESLTPRQERRYFTLGGATSGRMPAARHRLLEDKFYVPLAELVQIGMESLQQDTRIARLYSQCAGLADFFMQSGDGRYRDAVVRYLGAIYSGRATTRTLAEMTGTNYETLDRQYREFISRTAPADSDAASDAAR